MGPRQVFPFCMFGFVLSMSFFPGSWMENDPAAVFCSAFTRWNLSFCLQCCFAGCWDHGSLILHPLHPISKKYSKGSPRSLETWTVVNIPARHLECAFRLESLKLLPRVGKTDGQTDTLTFAVFYHLAREELTAVWNVTASYAVIVHPSEYLSH